MTFDLYRNISDTDAQFFVGGGGVTSGVDFVDADDTDGTAGWHHLGPGHVNPSANGNDQIDDFGNDPTAQLHNFTATAGDSGQTPTA